MENIGKWITDNWEAIVTFFDKIFGIVEKILEK